MDEHALNGKITVSAVIFFADNERLDTFFLISLLF